MERIKKGDIVGRISYGKDILFVVDKIIKCSNKKSFAILKGLTMRIIADSPLEDLEIMEKEKISNNMRSIDTKLEKRVKENAKRNSQQVLEKMMRIKESHLQQKMVTGTILHLDGDRKYTEKSYQYYKNMGLKAIVKNVAENKQPVYIKTLLEKYKPDILVITGHDGMIKNGTGYNDLYNYRNSRYFLQTVEEARKWDIKNQLVIFAGACQSYFEALISAGANFASSPARILIDFADPLIVAEKIATTEYFKYVTINDIANELRDGEKGIGGIGANGKREIILV